MPEDLLETASRPCGDVVTHRTSSLSLSVRPWVLERHCARLDPTIPETSSEILEIDLDEDEPLREEYI